MNFFEAQELSRRSTRRLIMLYLLATLAIVVAVTAIVGVAFGQVSPLTLSGPGDFPSWLGANTGLLGGTAAATGGFIGLTSAYKIARLSSGGARVALDMGGTEVTGDAADPLRRRLRNVVEEMAIASGVPVPRLFVMEREDGINAFAAGFGPEDAAIAVTRGALESLNRDELQGVIAHEFSHVLNGDMRLNIRLMGVLFGILAIAVIGRFLLRHARSGRVRSSSSDRGGVAAFALLGLGLYLVGSVGVLLSRMIKAGVSRQREYLADASAVQFTRQTAGLAGALKKIGGLAQSSILHAADTEEVSHMLFAAGQRGFAGLFATHPPLDERIRRLDSQFDGAIAVTAGDASAGTAGDERSVAFAGPPGPDSAPIEPGRWLDSAGRAEQRHIAWAGRLRIALPELLDSAAHSRDQSVLLVLALALDTDEIERKRQLGRIGARLGELRARRVSELHDELLQLGAAARLPLLDLAFPALRDRPAGQLQFLLDLIDELIASDGRIALAEYCFARLVRAHVRDALTPARPLTGRRSLESSRDSRRAAATLLGEFARAGHPGEAERAKARAAGLQVLSLAADDSVEDATAGNWVQRLDRAIATLNRLDARSKRRIIEALIAVARYDDGIEVAEAERIVHDERPIYVPILIECVVDLHLHAVAFQRFDMGFGQLQAA
ncbi:MAG: M48 family metallopeptidase [Pseudomonadota bacterium]